MKRCYWLVKGPAWTTAELVVHHPHRVHAQAHPSCGGPFGRSGYAFVRVCPRHRRRPRSLRQPRQHHPRCRTRHRFQHQAHRYRDRQPRAGDRPAGDRSDRQGHRGRPAALDLGQHRQRQQRDHQQRLGFRFGRHRPARPVAEEHPGAAQWPPPGQLRLPGRWPVRHLRQPQRPADGRRRAHRSAEGRCVRRIRFRCRGRRGQHHHPPELPGRRSRRQCRHLRPGRAGRTER
jgi:hypothetical protein